MKTIYFYFILAMLLASCGTNKSGGMEEEFPAGSEDTESGISGSESLDSEEISSEKKAAFDINELPVSDAELGDFPFFSFPEGFKALNKPITRKYDVIYFPIDGVMTPLEGRVMKTYVTEADDAEEDWSTAYFFKSYDDIITSVGGTKIFDEEISYEEYERYHDKATYLGEDGSIGYVGETIKVYVIRREDGGNIFIQLSDGNLNILQQEVFQQTISLLKSEKINKELAERGKVVLYINFDTDKATLKSDGAQAVNEIYKALNEENDLKIEIRGYTDDTGTEARNKSLSEERGATIVKELVKLGIERSRLSSVGLGSDDPIGDNNTEEGRAKNRRVELIKK